METRNSELFRDTKITSIQVSEDHKKPKLLMLVEVAGGLCIVGNNGQGLLKGRRKLKGQISAINTSRPLILPKKKKEEEDFGNFLDRSFLLFSLISLPNISKHI